ncbi:hypothetical protein [Pelagicoccus sp. SDUM812003]|uniref:hypothetical protein n=1 Tax=Pelagicoccus sp. SDUM812003 TaxID=3041267 RepID=UPI00280DD1A8|nr:hypothetical protein [Pelagicoccus sp. SDUM812003]MDQ8205874.1 hypothetical protein [Pelagicoccus sp. SDUM812003]
MKVTKEHKIDAGEKDSEGYYDYFYEYDIYTFTENGKKLTARKYIDDETAHFLRIENEGEERILTKEDLETSFISEAIEHLRNEGIEEVEYLANSGYERI